MNSMANKYIYEIMIERTSLVTHLVAFNVCVFQCEAAKVLLLLLLALVSLACEVVFII